MALNFRVAGFPVQVHPFFFLVTLGTGANLWRSPASLALWLAVVFLSVLVHEVGHGLAFRSLGHPASISLHGLGGTTTSQGGEPLTYRQDFWVSLAGPAAGFFLGLLVLAFERFIPMGHAGGLVGFGVSSLLWTSFGWGLLNLLPVRPLDGGHMMAAVVRQRGGHRAEWLIPAISLFTAACCLVLSILWPQRWLWLFALILVGANINAFAKAWIERKYMLGLRQASRARPVLDQDDAVPDVERFLTALHQPPPRDAPAEKEPPELPELPHDSQFVGELLLASGLPELSIAPLSKAFQQEPSAERGHALVTALLDAGRYEALTRLLDTSSQRHLGPTTLQLVATRAEAAHQGALATRARQLHQTRTAPGPRPARGSHDSKKPG